MARPRTLLAAAALAAAPALGAGPVLGAVPVLDAAQVGGCSSALPLAAVYDGCVPEAKAAPIKLTIGNGGAGESGLIKALADGFIRHSIEVCHEAPFRVAWIESDTTMTIQNLGAGLVDVGVTYSPAAEALAVAEGIAKAPARYLFRDHFDVVGPVDNPARLNASASVTALWSRLYEAAEAHGRGGPRVHFLSRFDKSATNIKESRLWTSIGQAPWADAISSWYHRYNHFPLEALRAAALLGEYTLTDRGTLLSLEPEMRAKLAVFKAGGDDAGDELLNPAHLLVSTRAAHASVADSFAAWAVSSEGQAVVEALTGTSGDGVGLYTRAPGEHRPATCGAAGTGTGGRRSG